MYMVEKSGKLLCRIVLIMLLFVLCFCASCGHKCRKRSIPTHSERLNPSSFTAKLALKSA